MKILKYIGFIITGALSPNMHWRNFQCRANSGHVQKIATVIKLLPAKTRMLQQQHHNVRG